MTLLPTDHRDDIERAIPDTYEAIEEALGYIQRQEDGPVTMSLALKDIQARVEALETEIADLLGSAGQLQIVAHQLRMQRDAAVEQRNTVIALVNRRVSGKQ